MILLFGKTQEKYAAEIWKFPENMYLPGLSQPLLGARVVGRVCWTGGRSGWGEGGLGGVEGLGWCGMKWRVRAWWSREGVWG